MAWYVTSMPATEAAAAGAVDALEPTALPALLGQQLQALSVSSLGRVGAATTTDIDAAEIAGVVALEGELYAGIEEMPSTGAGASDGLVAVALPPSPPRAPRAAE